MLIKITLCPIFVVFPFYLRVLLLLKTMLLLMFLFFLWWWCSIVDVLCACRFCRLVQWSYFSFLFVYFSSFSFFLYFLISFFLNCYVRIEYKSNKHIKIFMQNLVTNYFHPVASIILRRSMCSFQLVFFQRHHQDNIADPSEVLS